MTAPYTPTAFAAPILNPAVGGAGVPVAYVSNSQFKFAPTALDTANLVPGGTLAQQEQSLADVLARASAWADRYCFGTDPAAKGASLAATMSVQSAAVRAHGGYLKLVCDYKPILSVIGIDVGIDASSVQSVGASAASRLMFGRRTIYVPASAMVPPAGTLPGMPASTYVVWSYVAGYPHTSLAGSALAGGTAITVAPTDGASGVLGIFPGTQLHIVDGANTETVTVTNVAGTVLTVSPLAFTHTAPAAPDFLPVTTLPAEVVQAVMLLASVLIKARGDNSLVLASLTEPNAVQQSAGDEFTDLSLARRMLAPYRIRIKSAGL